MIQLFSRAPWSLLGVASMLDIEKIPYRRVSSAEDGSQALLIAAGGDLTPSDIAAIGRRPAIVLGGGVRFAHEMFGARGLEVHDGPCVIGLQQPVWPGPCVAIAAAHGKSALRIPLAPRCDSKVLARGTVLAACEARAPRGGAHPAIVRTGRCLWSAVDLGAAFANLVTERYLPAHKQHVASSALKVRARRAVEQVYYAAPQIARQWVQTRSYAALEQQLHADGECASEYPIDATGWLLIELLKSLIRHAAGSLVRLERWPAPYRAAATLTHDIEPRRYAYTTGLDRLLDQPLTTEAPSAFGLVAAASERYLTDERARRLRDREVLCHGLEHRGENVQGQPAVLASVATARNWLERRLGRPLNGYRSPRLDRSADLLWALDRSGFVYDSSYPDVDRENVRHFGGGVRLNLPFRPPVEDRAGVLRASHCLELPLTAPDCIQPLFAGHGQARLRATVESKAAFVRDSNGLYVALIHAGVFGPRDAAVREDHLRFVTSQLRHPDVWLAGIERIVDWWRTREALRISVEPGSARVINEGPAPMTGARIVIEHNGGEVVLPVPPLAPGAALTLPIPAEASVPAA